MRSIRCLLVLALASCGALPALAQVPVAKSDGSVSSAAPSRRTVAQLPACVTGIEGRRYTLTDAQSATDQTIGGGSNVHVAVCQQGVWIAENPASGGGVSDGDKSDITVSGGGVNWQIDADAVGASEIAAGAVGASEAAGLDAGDTTTGEFADARIGAAITRDAESPAAGDITGSHSAGYQVGANAIGAPEIATGAVAADELDEVAVEAGLEAVLDLQDQQGAVNDAQVPNTITIDAATRSGVIDSTGTAATTYRFDATERCLYRDRASAGVVGTRDSHFAEACLDPPGDGTFASDERPVVLRPETYERNGTTTTKGIAEAVAEAATFARAATVRLGSIRLYEHTGATPITITQTGMTLEGEGVGAIVRCRPANGCSANPVILVEANNVRIRNISVVQEVANADAIRIGTSGTSYPSGVVIQDNLIDGDSTLAAGSRGTGAGIRILGLENRVTNNQIRWFGDAIKLAGHSLGRANANALTQNRISSTDDGVTCTVGGFAANKGDCEGILLRENTLQSIYRYGVYAVGGTADDDQFNSVHSVKNWYEGLDTGIYCDGSSATRDPQCVSDGDNFSATVDVAGTAGRPDADSLGDSLVTTSANGSDHFVRHARQNSVQCITHAGSGALYHGGDRFDANPCVPSVTGSGVLRDMDADLGWRDEATTLTADWVNTANPWADNEVSDTLTASTSTTAGANDNDTSIATTAFVQQEIDDGDLLTDNCALENDSTPIPDSCVGDGTDGGGGGGATVLDLGDDAANESAGITEIATTGDTTGVFTEPSADKLLVDAAQPWPSALNLKTDGTAIGNESVEVTGSVVNIDPDQTGVADYQFTDTQLYFGSLTTGLQFEGTTSDANENELRTEDPIGDAIFQIPALATGTYKLATREAAETFSGVKTFSVAPNLAASSVDAIGEIASALRIGSGTKLVTGLEGVDVVTIETPSSANTVRWLVTNPGSGGVSVESEADAVNGGTLRAYEGLDDGANFFGFKVPNSGLTLDREITLEDDANPIPDAAVGDGVDDDVPEAADLGAITAGNGLTSPATGTLDVNPGLGMRISSDTIGFDPTAALSGDHALGANECKWGASGIICEGSAADAFEAYIAFTNPTADRTVTIPDAASATVQPITCGGTDKLSSISSAGVATCSADQTSAGSNDSIRVEDGNDAGTFTAATDADFGDSGDINFALDTGASPDEITATVRADSVALGTDTTGGYAASSSEGGNATLANAATALAANGANCSAGSVAGGVDASGAAESCLDPLTSSDTETITNKTIDAEAAGNVVTLPIQIPLAAAGCTNTTAASFWDLPTSSPAVAACRTGTNVTGGVLDFADGSSLTAQTSFRLPTGWTGAIDAVVDWQATATAGDVVWKLAIACSGDGDSDDPAFTDDAFTPDTAKGTANQRNDTSSNTITTTGSCAAGDLARVRVKRDSADAGDTMAATARLMGVHIIVRAAL
jgi:hypothetical protein